MQTDKKKDIEPQLAQAINNLKVIVALSDMTATEISRAAGLSPNVLGKFLRRESSLSYINMVAICRELDVPIGIIGSPVPISPARIRLYRLLNQMAEDQVEVALQAIQRKRA